MAAAARFLQGTISDDDDFLSEYDSSFEGSDDDAPDDAHDAHDAAGTGENFDEYIKRRILECDHFLKEMYHFWQRPGVIDAGDPTGFYRDRGMTVGTTPTIEEYDSIEKKCIEFSMSQLNEPSNDQNIMRLDEVFKLLSVIIDRLHLILKFPFFYYKDRPTTDKEWTPNHFFDNYFKKLEKILEKIAYYNIIRSPYSLLHITGEPDEPSRYDRFSEFKHAIGYANIQANIKAKAIILGTRRNIVGELNKELRKKYGNRYIAYLYEPPGTQFFWYHDTQANQSLSENPILTQAKIAIDEHEKLLTPQLNAYIASLVKKAVVEKSNIFAGNSAWFFKVIFPEIPELNGVKLVVPFPLNDWRGITKYPPADHGVDLRSSFIEHYPEIARPIFNGYSGGFGIYFEGVKRYGGTEIPNGATVELRYSPLKSWSRYESGISIQWPKGGKKTKSKTKTKSKSKSKSKTKSKTKTKTTSKTKTKTKFKSKRNKRRSYKRLQ